jgi:ATP-dependent helicase HrpA
VRRFAQAGDAELAFDPESKRSPLVLRRRVDYFGFDLERMVESVDVFPVERRERARRLLAEALAREEARHLGVKRNRRLIEAVRETWRRSGGRTASLSQAALAALYESKLARVESLSDFRHADLDLTSELEALVPASLRNDYLRLPNRVTIRDRDVEIHYDVEDSPAGPRGIARLRLPEKLARTLSEGELPTLDRPLRFLVTRGARGAARAETLEALQEELERPFTEDELEQLNRAWEARRDERRARKRQRRRHDGGNVDGGAGEERRRRKQRPGRRERAEQRPDRGPRRRRRPR